MLDNFYKVVIVIKIVIDIVPITIYCYDKLKEYNYLSWVNSDENKKNNRDYEYYSNNGFINQDF